MSMSRSISSKMARPMTAALTAGRGSSSASATITAQPTNQTEDEGDTATFTIAGTNFGGVQAQRQPNGIGEWENVSGATFDSTSASYTTPELTPANQNDRYRFVVNGDTFSEFASLTVNLSILSVVSTTLTWGQRPEFTVDATGDLQMQISTNNVDFTDISGAIGTNPTVPRLFPGTYYYRCKITDGGVTYSNTRTITVTNLGVKILYRPSAGDDISTTITDLSGNGNHATAVNPATINATGLNGKPTYQFDGTNDRYTITPAAGLFRNKNKGFIFAVCNADADRNLIYFSTGTTAAAAPRASINSSAGVLRITGRRDDATGQFNAVSGTAHSGAWQAVMAVIDWQNSDAFLYENGSLTGSQSTFGTDGSTSDTDSLVVTFGAANITSFWNGGCAVLGVGDTIPTPQQQVELNLWVEQEYGLTITPTPFDTSASLTYSSSIDPSLTNLKAKLHYTSNATGGTRPLLVICHGWSGQVNEFDSAVGPRWLARGINVLMVEMRGRGLSDGTPDGGGREVYDIIDAIRYAEASGLVDIDLSKVHCVGYSGGGGNVLSMAARFPDFFGVAVSFFGISDYGWSSPDGWWYANNASRAAQLTAWIGDRPTYPARYKARSSLLGITNFPGRLRLYHDTGDNSVKVAMTNNVVSTRPSSIASITTPSDNPRWTHTSPNGSASIIQAEPTFAAEILSGTYDAVPLTSSTTLKICGWVETSGWAVWLGDGTADFGEVVYTAGATPSFDITSDYSQAITVHVKGLTPSASKTVEINGVEYTETADADGVATFVP